MARCGKAKINNHRTLVSEKPQLGEKRKRLSVKMEAGAKCHEAQKKGGRVREPQMRGDVGVRPPPQPGVVTCTFPARTLRRYVCDATSASFKTL